MRTIVLLGAVTASLIVSAASAADMPSAPPYYPPQTYVPAPPPAYNWAGFYVGGNAGYGWASSSGTDTYSGGALGGIAATGTYNVQGAIAGGQVGYNYQIDHFVIGAEGDWQWSDQQKTQTYVCGGSCSISETGQAKWFATLRARFGVAFDRALLYATGGVAWLNAGDNDNATVGGTNFSLLNTNGTQAGLAAGGGLEFGITENISAKVEYLYMRFDNVNNTATLSPILGGTVTLNGTITDSVVRAGLNVRFPVGH